MHRNTAAWYHPIAETANAGLEQGIIIAATTSASIGSDFSEFTSWNDGRFLYGSTTSGATGGSYNVSNFGLSSGGSHNTNSSSQRIFQRISGGSANTSAYGPNTAGSHSHSMSGTSSHVPKRANLRLIQANTDGAEIPVGAIFFSDQASLGASDDDCTTLNDQDAYLYPHTSTGITNASNSWGSTTSTSDSHNHHPMGGRSSFGGGVNCNGASLPTIENAGGSNGGGSHNHSLGGSMSARVKCCILKAFERVAASEPIEASTIAMWDSNNGSPPSNWNVCDGTNGTPDLRDHFVKFGTSSLGGTEGDGKISVSVSTGSKSHSHSYSSNKTGWGCNYAHASSKSHSHSGSQTQNYTPQYRTVVFIKKAA